jgi:NADPH:quinone reductase-like Zn-dependent oxidoreductase
VFDPVSLPGTPGYDAVGIIQEIGSAVNADEWKIGDRVAALIRTGGNARYAIIPSSSLVHVPKSIDASEAVCMVSTYMTAYQALKLTLDPEEKKGSKPFDGKKVLVVGGTGPVGQALVQLALKAGASEVYATGPTSRHRYMKMIMGAKPLPYETEEWLPEVKGQMDLVFDGACQDGYESSHAALNEKGKLVTVGMYAMLHQEQPGLFGAPLSAFFMDAKSTLFMSQTQSYEVWSSFKKDPNTFKADMEKLFNKLKKNQIHPVIAKRIGLADVPDAHVLLEKGKARGPIVCIPWKRSPKVLRENDHIPLEITTTSQPDDAREEHNEGGEKRGLFRRRSKMHQGEEHGERENEREVETEKEAEEKHKKKRSWRKKKDEE